MSSGQGRQPWRLCKPWLPFHLRGFWAGRHDTKQPRPASGHGPVSIVPDGTGMIPPAVLPSAECHRIRPGDADPSTITYRNREMFTPRAARRTALRRLRRDHRPVVDAQIAAADNPSRRAAGRVPVLSCCRTYLARQLCGHHRPAGPLLDRKSYRSKTVSAPAAVPSMGGPWPLCARRLSVSTAARPAAFSSVRGGRGKTSASAHANKGQRNSAAAVRPLPGFRPIAGEGARETR